MEKNKKLMEINDVFIIMKLIPKGFINLLAVSKDINRNVHVIPHYKNGVNVEIDISR